MKELVYLKNDKAVCDSLQVAEKFGKEHRNVLRAIDNLRETLLNFEQPSKMFAVSKRKLDELSLVEHLIAHTLKIGMAAGQSYRNIYQICKDRLEAMQRLQCIA